MPPDKAKRNPELTYDDTASFEVVDGKLAWAKSPDELDVRWERGQRGWLSVRDPVTLERHVLPTKYATVLLGSGEIVVDQWMVRRAMDKLPPKPKPRLLPPLPPVPDDGGPL